VFVAGGGAENHPTPPPTPWLGLFADFRVG
jgi:hypothetical protein